MRAALAALLLLVPGLAGAQVYKCTDANGRVHYSQSKPRDADCQETAVKPAPKVGTDVDGLMRMGKQIDESRKLETKSQEKAQRIEAQQAQRCSYARSQLHLLQQTGRLVLIDDKGERHYQDDPGKAALMAEAGQRVAEYCN